jgi:hypothetical protein
MLFCGGLAFLALAALTLFGARALRDTELTARRLRRQIESVEVFCNLTMIGIMSLLLGVVLP